MNGQKMTGGRRGDADRLAPVEVESGLLLRNSPVALLIPHPESDAQWLPALLCLIPNLNSPNQELLRAVPV